MSINLSKSKQAQVHTMGFSLLRAGMEMDSNREDRIGRKRRGNKTVSTSDISILKNTFIIHPASFVSSLEQKLSSSSYTTYDLIRVIPCFLGYVFILPISITSYCPSDVLQ